jgi:hypothetical protein
MSKAHSFSIMGFRKGSDKIRLQFSNFKPLAMNENQPQPLPVKEGKLIFQVLISNAR